MTISFGRLTDVPASELLRVLNDRRLARHMPLWGEFTAASVLDWAAAKTAHLDEHGYGPRSVLVDGTFVGWAGVQPEEYGLDLAVVLAPSAWGIGLDVVKLVLADADAQGIRELFIALPPTRHSDRVVSRFGFERVADDQEGFILYRRLAASRPESSA